MTSRAPSAVPASGTLLIVDDEPQIRRVVRNALVSDFARVLEAVDGRAAVDLAAAECPSMIILDLGLPDALGISVCREIRAFLAAPIVVLSARHEDTEKVALLDAGVDDYVTKPFNPDELRARVRAHLRRAAASTLAAAAPLSVGDLAIDLEARIVRRAGEPVHLTPIEWGLLRTFANHAGRTLTHRQLFTAVWGSASSQTIQRSSGCAYT